MFKLRPRYYDDGVVNTESVTTIYVRRDAVDHVVATSDYQPKDDPDPVKRCIVTVGRAYYTLHESVDSVVTRLGGYA